MTQHPSKLYTLLFLLSLLTCIRASLELNTHFTVIKRSHHPLAKRNPAPDNSPSGAYVPVRVPCPADLRVRLPPPVKVSIALLYRKATRLNH